MRHDKRRILRSTCRAVTSDMRETDTRERTVQYRVAGEHGPSDEHLVSLARHSNAAPIQRSAMAERLVLVD